MHLTKSQIKELQDIFKEEYNQKLTWKEATDAAYRLVGFFKLLNKINARQYQKNKKSSKLSVFTDMIRN